MGNEAVKSGLVFTIGLTGHRDIRPDALAQVRDAIRTELEALKARFSNLPIELVTGLADGADTLATEVALEIGLPVRAVLPMPRALYEADFEGAALEDFKRLAEDERVVIEKLPLPPGETADLQVHGPARDALYGRLMDYLVRRSNVLVALWDGEVTGLTGGTSDVVVRYLANSDIQADEARPHEIFDDADLAEDRTDLVVWIKTPRQSGDPHSAKVDTNYLVQAGTTGLLCRLSAIPETVLQRWDEFSEYASERNSDLGSDLPAYPISVPEDAEIAEITASIDADFVRADQLALINQRQSDRLFKLFGLMAAMMGLTFLLYAKIAALKWFLIAYILLFAAGYVLFEIGARRGWFGRHLAFRALAEALRVRFFIVLSGSGDAFETRYLLGLTSIERFARFGWIRDAIRCTEPLTYESDVPTRRRIAETTERWVKDQSAYFHKKHRQLHHEHERLEVVKKVLFLAAFLGAVSLLFFKKSLYHFHIGELDGKTLVVFLMGLLPLWLAIWEIYQTKMAIRELLWQYANQGTLFEMAEKRLEATSDPTHAQDVIGDLAERSLMDVVQWSTHRYHREHEPPSAG
ncbi:hypothetical protein SAMN04488026_10638 [Aliiruegeria lutimaris]|uniref:SMODS and SLOG-associating 2TM effector domain-containing protein n=1 Tax=Aliiruegeria lutimaris TaxID=571298 RepID=A0A1G9GG78_9RHOB|nr:hypothetical protein SAMN04488026_10638 [Aliiruegeria lutimaris]